MSQPRRSFSAGPATGTDAQLEAIDDLRQHFKLTDEELKRFRDDLRVEMDHGLKSHESNMAMLPSWVFKHPTGQETGEYLGLELNGSNVRMYLVNLHGQGRITTRQQKLVVHDHLKKGSVTAMIDFLAESVDSFLSFVGKYELKQPLALGFVLSFPLEQHALNKAVVLQWTKDFEVTGANGKNIAELLQIAFRRRHINVNVEAVINGAVGCLLAHSYRSLDTLVACTISTGTNAAYWEKVESIEKNKDKLKDCRESDMIINTEWGSFGDNNPTLLPRTFYDNRLNRQSVNPGVHVFEKMVSGLYLGEIVRLIMVDFLDRRLLFDGQYTPELNTPYQFEASYISAVNSDETLELEGTKHILESIMNLPSTTLSDRQIVRTICELVSQRAARLVAAAMSAIIDKRNAIEEGLTISMEGTVYEHFPNFPGRVNDALRSFYGDRVAHINVGITRDGNGIGAALAAMLAISQKQQA
ncbi:hexokinase-domain-containing protein [Gilbertella persicaria]|uniref:hexokinase-domain-containing protein n=1 Tax=Gilbertella persicaria TaxID=101096 RepID=UPI00221EFA69|nr:hexokinase-domain-containing protein [Gilbertella persicaria]KAI8094874.1 hexokinase-domain-containing protein [Gilbertella persicaria]